MNEPDPLAADPGALLIARIVERAALPADYERFGALAQTEPGRWSELLSALSDDDALHLALDDSLRDAERVELPLLPAPATGLRALRPWTGWMAAAALALVWLLGTAVPGSETSRPEGDGSLALAPQDAGPRLRDEPPAADDPVLGALPLRFVATQPASDGEGLDLLYVQPVVRRARIDGVLQLRTDEHGNPAPVAVDPAVLVRRETL